MDISFSKKLMTIASYIFSTMQIIAVFRRYNFAFFCRVCGLVQAICFLGLLTPKLAAQEPDKYALMIGIDEYDHSEITKLDYPETDAKAVGALLKASGYHVDYLLGNQATHAAIRDYLGKCSDRGSNKGVVVIGVFGHGIEFESSKKSYYLPFDTRMKAVKDADGRLLFTAEGTPMVSPDAGRMISIDELLVALRESKAKNRVLLADCCRDDPNRARFRSFGSALKQNELPKDAAVFFACSENERAYEHKDWGHGAFTKCILEQLSMGKSLMGSLAEEVAPAVEQLTASKLNPGEPGQNPRFLSTGARIDLMLASQKIQPISSLQSQIDTLRLLSLRFGKRSREHAKAFADSLQSKAQNNDEYLFLCSYLAKQEEKLKFCEELKKRFPMSYFALVCEHDYLYSLESSSSFDKAKYEACVALLDQLITMRPYDEFTILALEETLAWSKFANEASQSRCLDLLKNAVSHRPNSAFIQHALGNQLQDSDLDTAILHLSKAIELDPAAPAYYNVRGHAYLWKEQYDNAIRDFEIALAIDPTYVNAAMQKANCLVSKGMRKEAKDFLSSLRESDFESFDFVYIGGLMVMIDEVEKAEQYFQKAIKLEPSNRDAFVELADVLSDENPTNFENLLRQAKENLSARDFASVEIMVCARTGGLRKIHDLTKNGTESLSSMSVLLVKAFRTSLGDSKALQSILEDKKVPAQSISKIIDEFENAGTITVSVPVGQPGSVSLLTSTGIREIASGTSSIIKVGLSFDAEFDASSTKLPSYVPVVCFFTGDRTVLGEEKWQLAPLPLGSASIEFATRVSNGKKVWYVVE